MPHGHRSRAADPIDYDCIAAFCEANGIHRLALFGSVLTDRFGPESDIDVLVEFFPERIPGWNYSVMNEPLISQIERILVSEFPDTEAPS